MTGHIRGSLLYHVLASLPLLTFAVVFFVTKLTRISSVSLPWKWLSIGLVLLLILPGVAYLFLPIILDDAESAVAGASEMAVRGLPIYPAPLAAARYGLVYGPVASLWHVPFYFLFGRDLFAFKLAGVLAFLFSLFGIYQVCRKYADPGSSLLGLGCASVLLLQYVGYDFWGRSDPLILLLLVASIWVTITGPDWGVLAMAAITIGALPNLKISAVAYLLPCLGFVVIRRGWRIGISALGLSLCLIAVPFALPQVSLSNYLFLLNVVKHQGLSLDFFARNVQYSLIVLIPLAALGGYTRLQLCYFGLIGFGMAVTCVLGSKIGAGNYHLFPYVVPALHLYFWRRSELPAADRDLVASRYAIPWIVTLLFYSTAHLADVLRAFQFSPLGNVAVAEIRRAEDTYKGRAVEVGVGDESADPRISYGAVTAFDGEPYTMNFQSVRDTQFGGVELPESTIRYIRDCGTGVWLIPKDQVPFAASNSYYERNHPAFGDELQSTFERSYDKVESGAMYDVWLCGPSKSMRSLR